MVIPCHPKDEILLSLCIASLIRCCPQIRIITVISPDPDRLSLASDPAFARVRWVGEDAFPFQLNDLGSGWRYQQALKLYAPLVLPDLLDDVVLVDADTVWHTEQLAFVQHDGVALYSVSRQASDIEGYEPFFHLLKSWGIHRVSAEQSGIVHHMVFQREILVALHLHVPSLWKILSTGKPSEWELYYNFAFARYPKRVARRPLRFIVTGSVEQARCPGPGVDFVACHSHRRLGFVDTHEDGDYSAKQSRAWQSGRRSQHACHYVNLSSILLVFSLAVVVKLLVEWLRTGRLA